MAFLVRGSKKRKKEKHLGLTWIVTVPIGKASWDLMR